MEKKVQKFGAAAFVIAVVAVTVGATAASAAVPQSVNSCTTHIQENVQWPLDTEYRVVASCSSLDPNTRARGVMDMHWAPDDHTEWFTATGTTYYSSWHFSLWGITPSSRIELAPR